jgi:hypothetical protein
VLGSLMRQAVGRNRLFDLRGGRGNIDASQHDKPDDKQRHNRGNNDEKDLHKHPANCQSRTAL